MNYSQYPAKWQERFNFFDQWGKPGSKEFRVAFRAIPSIWQRVKIQSNFLAFFFGIIYLFYLGLWKKALTLLAGAFVLGVISEIFGAPDAVVNAIGIAYSICCSMIANYAYYLKEVKHQQSWNPFEGFGK